MADSGSEVKIVTPSSVTIERVKQIKSQRIRECDENIKRLNEVVKSLESVREKIKTLPDRTRHDVPGLVGITTNPTSPPPILMRGYLKHTNEFLVLLGDNWFVERSAKQSLEILDRRLDKTNALIRKFEEEKKSHENWSTFANSIKSEKDQFVEIQEEYDEERERKWREDHQRRVREYNQQLALERKMQKFNLNDLKDNDDKETPIEAEVKERPIAVTSVTTGSITPSASKSDEPKDIATSTETKPISKFKAARLSQKTK